MRGLCYTARIGLVTAAAILISTAAPAGTAPTPVQYFVNVQPIDVCPTIIPLASASSGCAPVGAAGSSQFGFVDSNGIDITRAILNQASIDVNFQPLGFIDDSRF